MRLHHGYNSSTCTEQEGPDLEIARALRDLEHKFVNGRKNIYHKSRTKATRDTNPALTSVL